MRKPEGSRCWPGRGVMLDGDSPRELQQCIRQHSCGFISTYRGQWSLVRAPDKTSWFWACETKQNSSQDTKTVEVKSSSLKYNLHLKWVNFMLCIVLWFLVYSQSFVIIPKFITLSSPQKETLCPLAVTLS